MKDDLRGLYAAIILSALVVLGVNYFFPKPAAPKTATVATATVQTAEETD